MERTNLHNFPMLFNTAFDIYLFFEYNAHAFTFIFDGHYGMELNE